MRASPSLTCRRAAALALAGCSQATSLVTGEPTWQEALADELAGSMTDAEAQEMCASLAMFGIDTPEELGGMIIGLSGEALPDSDTTIAEWAEITGEPLEDIPFSIDVNEVTINDLINETGKIMLAQCEV